MPKKTLDFYEIIVKFSMRKKFWDADNNTLDEDIIMDKLQQGIEVPIEDVEVTIRE